MGSVLDTQHLATGNPYMAIETLNVNETTQGQDRYRGIKGRCETHCEEQKEFGVRNGGVIIYIGSHRISWKGLARQ